MAKDRKPTSVPIGTIKTHIDDAFEVGEKIGDGGSGVVYRATSLGKTQETVAVKFYLLPQQPSALGTTTLQAFWNVRDVDRPVYESERAALKHLKHPAIQEVIGWGFIDDAHAKFQHEHAFAVPGDRVEFLVSRYIDGLSLAAWVTGLHRTAQTATLPQKHDIRTLVIDALTDVLDALAYLHEDCQHQHSDIRSENIRIHTASQRPILIDFGYAQAFSDEFLRANPVTRIPPLRLLNAPDALESQINSRRDDTGKIDREALKGLIFPGLDMYQFGRVLRELIDHCHVGDLISALDLDLLELIAQDLQTWTIARVTKASDVLGQLRKLKDGYWSAASAPQAAQLAPGQPVREIALPTGSFTASRLVEQIIETSAFRRLQRLKQLALLDYIYPGATETRFSHSLAVYSTAVDLVNHLVRSPRFTKLFDTQSAGQLLITALLHDINHFPFLHYFQELEIAQAEAEDFFTMFMSGRITGDRPSISDLLNDAGLSAEDVVNVLTSNYGHLSTPQHQVIKSAIDSGVDIDKLCYVPGDAKATGVPFGRGVDRAALLAGADIFIPKGHEQQWHLCFWPRALSAVESLLCARYWNFRQIYWHHTNRAIGAMLSHVVRSLHKAGALDMRAYVERTHLASEVEALEYLNGLYREHFKEPSILEGLATDRKRLFKRLLSIRPPAGTAALGEERRRSKTISTLERMSDDDRTQVAGRVARRLHEIFPSIPQNPTVLLDFPGRPLSDDVQQVFVCELNRDGSSSREVGSPFVATLKQEFYSMARTIRLFIPAEIRDRIGKPKLAQSVHELEKLVEESLSPGKSVNTTVR